MNWTDIVRMSSSSLRRRKLRTFLTVLGVIIGTTSIVVMISLGLGMKESLYREVEQSGGVTSITVTGQAVGDSMVYDSSDGDSGDAAKYISDETLKKLGGMSHVVSTYPEYDMTAILLSGAYEGYGSLKALPREALEEMNIPLEQGGELPEQGGPLEFVYGNGAATLFYEKNTGKSYWDTGELPNIDFAADTMFLILDQEAYEKSKESKASAGNLMGGADGETDSGSDGSAGDEAYSGADSAGDSEISASSSTVQKRAVRASGIVEGGPEVYTSFYYYIYCDLDALRKELRKEFAGGVIPGQPTTKTGKPYKEFFYSSAQVKVDDIEYVDAVAEEIRRLGYTAETNAEYLESMQKEFAIVEAVLGGIGAISLFVAAIGIANTMIMSIYERTKEIGVIKVLGCSLRDIRRMFLMEAAFIGLFGGAAGNILSFLLSALINIVTGHGAALGYDGDISCIPWWLCLMSLVFAVLVGVTAGYFPAKRAMKLSPLAAIRSE